MTATRICRRGCGLPCAPRSQFCTFHRLMKKPPHEQASAAEERLAQHTGRRREQVPKSQWPNGERWCAGCQSFLPSFYFNGTKCRGCSSKATHAARVEQVYGITGDEYDQLLKRQLGVCAICGNRPGKTRLAVDHNHKTGEVRGLLCKTCNHRLLGAAKEDPAILRKAATYLESPPARYFLRP